MARKIVEPRKQRTRQHVIADQSVNLVEGFIIDEGHTAQRVEKDYGYDLLLFTFDEQGYAEPGLVCLQLNQILILRDGISLADQDGEDVARFDILTEIRQCDLVGHGP